MLKTIKIEHFKSIEDLNISVGRFNILIGENGAGKSNFLEALAVYGAVEAGKFDNEFLESRGIRTTTSAAMIAKFTKNIHEANIFATCDSGNTKDTYKATIKGSDKIYSAFESQIESYQSKAQNKSDIFNHEVIGKIELPPNIKALVDIVGEANPEDKKEEISSYMQSLGEESQIQSFINDIRTFVDELKDRSKEKIMKDFIIFSPENTKMRKLESDGNILPLGVNGEGLFKLLQTMKKEEPDAFEEVISCASMFDWVDEIQICDENEHAEQKINITDQYLEDVLDQRSANEGFLFVLFYSALFCSKFTPKIFAIDNIDASLNPRMCQELIHQLINLAKKYDKQVFATTHNPAILDGMNLFDEDQALFIVNRNPSGHTQLQRLNSKNLPQELISGEDVNRLSEAFIRGYLGGLPKNF